MNTTKTLILNNQKDNLFKCILNLKQDGMSTIKLFNHDFSKKNIALGLKQKDSVIKIPLSIKNNSGQFSLPKNLDFHENIVCAVVDVTNAFCPEILLSGSVNTSQENTKIESAFVTKKPENTSVLYEEESQEELDKIIDNNLKDDESSTYFDACSNCRYRKIFYDEGKCACSASQDFQNTNVENLSNKTSENQAQNEKILKVGSQENLDEDREENTNSFYEQVKDQIDALFNRYDREEILENIIPNSKWAKVVYEPGSDEEYYVLGLVYDEDEKNVEYISYGMPSTDSKNPPDDLKDYAQWLPIDFENQDERGYWIVYQKASNGETIKIDFV